ncbi:MAG TPA: hypothetical protein PKG54_19625 [Phycisphaerae bacterium]|jgi:hypothetical protein|nr:hypothetical protein [Phycisphaerae bacterium]HOB76727.1 hypothetical protein [Phycisphaerae bacterium]HOJ56768.1 hypothetical protein [Phycisphaerae bacterium]HOL28513.1 hypothetical protein [Phycisphaerae bacterium]HPP23038.1 hypothetical protein [Phycisphaerae bacterium]
MDVNRLLGACVILAILVGTPFVHGQAFIQQGNALDANPRVGSGGLNYGARQYAPNAANRIVTGNVAGGGSFRGFSPIRDPSSLFFNNYNSPYYGGSGDLGLSGLGSYNSQYGLPSDRLSLFNRESVSVNTIRQSGGLANANRTPYYSPGSTVANTGAIVAGLNRPGSSQLISPYTPARPDMRITPPNPLDTARTGGGSLLNISPRLVRIDSGAQLTGPVNQRLLDSRLFGAVREVPITDLASQAQRSSGRALSAPPPDMTRPRPGLLPDGTEPRLIPEEPSMEDIEDLPGNLRVASEAGRLAAGGPNAALRGTDRTLARAISPLPDREATARAEQRGATGRQPGAGAGQPDLDSAGPLRSFVGTQVTAADRYLEEAEDLLKKGQYYRAADAFAVAQAIDPGDPLPLLGRSAALLLAGDYMSSANLLFTTIRLFESQAALRVDLKALVSDIVLLETRRSDLEERLQLFNDFRLRFLLGYLQFSTGQPEDGLLNMRQAAQEAPAELGALKGFVARLKEKSSSGPSTRPAK